MKILTLFFREMPLKHFGFKIYKYHGSRSELQIRFNISVFEYLTLRENEQKASIVLIRLHPQTILDLKRVSLTFFSILDFSLA